MRVLLPLVLLLAPMMMTSCTVTLHEHDVLPAPRVQAGALAATGVERKNVDIAVDDTTHLRGYYVTRAGNRRAMIYFGPNGGVIWEATPLYYWMAAELRCNVLAVDYRGYGLSDGKATMAAIQSDAPKVYDYLRDSLGVARPPFAYGFSLGSFVASQLANVRPVAGLILQGTAPSGADMIPGFKSEIPRPIRWFLRFKVSADLAQLAPQFEVHIQTPAPLLVVQGADDKIAPVTLARRVLAAAGSTEKHLCVIPDVGHNDLDPTRSPAADSLRVFVMLHGPEEAGGPR